MTKEEKISALSKLMADGVFTADEFSRLVAALSPTETKSEEEKSPAERMYDGYIKNAVASVFKSPASVKFPPFDPSMVKQGTIRLDFKEQYVRYIETYVDAPNSYGAMLREDIIIGIDEDFHPLFWAQHTEISPLLGKSKGWTKMTRG